MYFVVGQIFKMKELLGYRLINLNDRSCVDVRLGDIRRMFQSMPSLGSEFLNAQYKADSGLLIGTQGALTKYQSITDNGSLINGKNLAICYKIFDEQTKKLGGYGICDGYGMIINVRVSKLTQLCETYTPSNFELVSTKQGVVAKSLGTDFPSVTMKLVQARKGYNSKLGEKDKGGTVCAEIKDSNSNSMLPAINVYSYDDIRESEFATSAQEKLFKAYNNMKKLSPYYHTILMSIKREATFAVPTLAVSEDTMYYNLKFITRLSVAELTFILIHEICHIAMRHSARHGKRDNELWNIATDLYINSIIARDFDCYFGQGEKDIATAQGHAVIKVPDDGIHLSTIGETLDFGVDTPESIYSKLIKENPPMPNQGGAGQGGQQGNSQQGQNSSQGGNDSGNQQGQQGGNGSGNQQGENQQSQNSQQGGNGSGNQQGQNNSQGGSQQGQFNGSSVSQSSSNLAVEGDESEQAGKFSEVRKVSVTYNGKRLEGKINMDIVTSEVGDSKDRNKRVEEKALDTVQRMKTAVEIKEEKIGEKLTKNAGQGANLMRRCIEFGLASRVDWRVILKNMCKTKPKKMYTLAQPNETYMNAGVTVASRRKIGKPTTITGIKVGIDVSGSISDKELMYYLSEINNIFNYYKVEGELIYWSTIVGNAGKFSTLKDMLKINPDSTGGTDVKCLFEYLAGETRVNKQFEETKVKDISCVIIFTDGCFSNNYEKYGRYFGRKTVWVIPDDRYVFNPPFGRIACLK